MGEKQQDEDYWADRMGKDMERAVRELLEQCKEGYLLACERESLELTDGRSEFNLNDLFAEIFFDRLLGINIRLSTEERG